MMNKMNEYICRYWSFLYLIVFLPRSNFWSPLFWFCLMLQTCNGGFPMEIQCQIMAISKGSNIVLTTMHDIVLL